MTNETGMEKQRQRANAYKALSLLYFQPDAELGEALDYLQDALQCLGKEELEPYVNEMRAAIDSGALQALRKDHAKLFIGPAALLAPPYGSVYLESGNRVMGETTLDVLACYSTAGLKVDNKKMKEPADHVAIELEFMYFLSCRYLDTGEEWLLELQNSFLKKHLGQWFDDFTGNVQEGSSTSFYKNLAVITREFIRAELQKEVVGSC